MDMEEGGYLRTGLLSPSQSVQSSTDIRGHLPHPRQSPLKPGGSKESQLIRIMDDGLYKIQRRFLNRNDERYGGQSDPEAVGYQGFSEMRQDIERLIDLVWTSGTPSLQIPYLLNLAMLVKQYLPDLPPSPSATFNVIGKLDLAFASLLQGRQIETGEILPGFDTGRGVSLTQKVRIKSIVDQTRVVVADVLGDADLNDDDGDEAEETEDEEDEEDFNMESETDVETDDGARQPAYQMNETVEMGIAKIYERVIVELGDLGGAPIGIVTDD